MESTLCNWINTFPELTKRCTSFTDLADGLLLSEILNQVIPSYFDMSTIKREAETNDYLKVANIKRIVSVLEAFHTKALGLSGRVKLDSAAIGQGDAKEIQKLIQVILGIVVQSENKATYIRNMQSMAPEQQRDLIILIDGIMQQQAALKQEAELAPPSTPRGMSEDDDFLKELDNQAKNMAQEKLALQDELDKIRHDYSIATSELSHIQSKNQTLLVQIRTLEEELQRARDEKNAPTEPSVDESFEIRKVDTSADLHERHKYHMDLEEKEKTISDLRKKLEEYAKYAQEVRHLRDETDLLREQAARVPELEDRVKKLQIKSEGIVDLKKQIKALQEQNDKYLNTNLELEEASKKLPILKAQLDKYKEQVATLSAGQSSINNTLKDKEEEIIKLNEELKQLHHDNKAKKSQLEHYQSELEMMRQEHEARLISSPIDDSLSEDTGVSDLALKERVARLELENKRLKAGEGIERVGELEDQLDDTKRLLEKVQQENESLKKQVKEGGSSSASSSQDYKELNQTYQSLMDEHEATITVMKKLEQEEKKHLEEINTLLKDRQQITELQTKLKLAQDKITALTTDKTKLEGYLRTAKSMIRDERAKNKENQDTELVKVQKQFDDTVSSLKNQLKEKEKEMAHFKSLLEESKDSSSREMKLMSSAVYNFGLELQRLKAPKPDLSLHQPKSMLAQKRIEFEKR